MASTLSRPIIDAMRQGSLLGPTWARGLSVGAILLLAISLLRALPSLNDPPRLALALGCASALGAALLLQSTWPHPLLVLVMGLAALGLGLVGLGGAELIGLVTSIAAAASRLDARLGAVWAVALGLGYVGVELAASASRSPADLAGTLLGLAFAYLAARTTWRLRQEQERTQRLLAELQASRDAQIEAAALGERARLAREIHDVLAHTLSALAIQLEGARMLLAERPGDPAALAIVERAHRLARDGLDETQRAVSALRGDRLPGPEALTQLAEAFERDTGRPCRVCIDGQPTPLGAEAQVALYRTAQEALTNVRKHARAAQVELVVRYQPSGAELLVEDQADGSAEPTEKLPSGGYGLVGMRERAELLGGSLEAGPTEAGFRVRLWLPA